MPYMNVIPPGLDFSNLKVDLPEDPVIKEMQQHKPAYGGITTPKAADSPKNETGRATKDLGASSERAHMHAQLALVLQTACQMLTRRLNAHLLHCC